MTNNRPCRDIHWIRSVLPHRYPFLLIDRILEINKEKAIALKNVSINEPFFQGHFPDLPIMPGVLIVEAMAQLGGAFAFEHQGGGTEKGYFMGMDKVRFRKPVYPGDQLIIQVILSKKKGSVYKFKGEARVNDELVAEAEILITVRENI